MPVATLSQAQFEWLREEPRRFVSGLSVPDKYGKRVRLGEDVQSTQKLIMADLLSDAETVVYNKVRQVRGSTTILSWLFTRLFWTADPISATVATNYDSTNEELWGRLRGFYDGLPPGLRRDLQQHNRKTMQFLRSKSRARCLSSRSPAGARSGTNQILVCDEVAYWFHAEQLWADLTATQIHGPATRTVIISTPNGPGGLFFEKYNAARMAVRQGDLKVRCRFFEWWKQPEYTMEVPPGWEPTQEEFAYAETYRLTPEQLFWRHDKIHGPKGIGIEKFRREFPSTEEEGFLDFGAGTWFDTEYLTRLEASLLDAPRKTGRLRLYERPVAGAAYALGVDPSLCTGGDYAVAQVLDDSGRQVAVLSTNTGSVEQFADEVAELAEHYNHARVLVESNAGGGGNIVLKRLQSYGVNLWQAPLENGERPTPGKSRHWTTSHANKEAAYSHLRQMVNGDVLDLQDLPTVQELTHIRHEDGTIEGRDGMKDDHAMALCLAAWNLRTLPKPVREPRYAPRKRTASDPWSRSRV